MGWCVSYLRARTGDVGRCSGIAACPQRNFSPANGQEGSSALYPLTSRGQAISTLTSRWGDLDKASLWVAGPPATDTVLAEVGQHYGNGREGPRLSTKALVASGLLLGDSFKPRSQGGLS